MPLNSAHWTFLNVLFCSIKQSKNPKIFNLLSCKIKKNIKHNWLMVAALVSTTKTVTTKGQMKNTELCLLFFQSYYSSHDPSDLSWDPNLGFIKFASNSVLEASGKVFSCFNMTMLPCTKPGSKRNGFLGSARSFWRHWPQQPLG